MVSDHVYLAGENPQVGLSRNNLPRNAMPNGHARVVSRRT